VIVRRERVDEDNGADEGEDEEGQGKVEEEEDSLLSGGHVGVVVVVACIGRKIPWEEDKEEEHSGSR
jgi:hypothetical protein